MNKIVQMLREGMKQKLIIGSGAVETVAPGASVYVAVPITVDSLLLKSIEVTCSKNTSFISEFFESAEMNNSRYNSGKVTGENYDVLDLPFVDKDETQTMHFMIHNTSEFESSYTIEVRGIGMK